MKSLRGGSKIRVGRAARPAANAYVTHLVTRVRPVSALITELSQTAENVISRWGIYHVLSVRVSVRRRARPYATPRRISQPAHNFLLCRDCPGVGTSSGPAGKEVSYHGNVGSTSVGYKPPPQHSPQTRGPSPHFPQEPVGPPANSPPLHINICGQVNASSFSPFFLSFFLRRPPNCNDRCDFRKTRCAALY